MKKNFLYRLYAAAFVGVCLVPSALMPVSKPDPDKEKRTLAELPKAKTSDGSLNFDYFSQFGDWFSDHMAFRQQFVNANARLRAVLLNTSADDDVIVGSDGWLYYAGTVDDYLRLNTLSDRGIGNICRNLRLISDYCSENGAKFVFTVAPNKNTLYPEHMPYNYVPAGGESNYEKLAEELAGEDFFCDMKKTLLETDSSIPLYHKTDTHWNNLGAYAGHVKLMDMLDRESCPTEGGWFTRNDRLGDLAAMLYPAEKAKDTQVYNDYEYTYSYVGKFKALDDISIRTRCENGEGSLLMFRDSYGEAILPYMAECFSEGEFSRAVPYRLDRAADRSVIIEIVERNLGDLQKYAPVMQAAEVDMAGIPCSCDEIRIDKAGQLTHIYGVLPDECFSGSRSEIYVTVGGKTYSAFNCFEDKLLGRDDETSDNGFSLYIAADGDITADDVQVSVVNG